MKTEELARLMYDAARAAFTKKREQFGTDQILAYAIFTHDSADSCTTVLATKSAYDAYEIASKEYFLFTPVEWGVGGDYAHFAKANEALETLYNLGDYEQDPEWHNKFRELVFEASVQGLERLVDEGFFGDEAERDQCFITLYLSDSETNQSHLKGWVKRLNTTSVNDRYLSLNHSVHSIHE
jgi:hypothetical protein